jgi:xanthine dehydrogenase accessory factor
VRVVAPAPAGEPATAIDPVCGMAVAAVAETPHVDHEGRRVYFCCDGCRSTWTRSHVPQ